MATHSRIKLVSMLYSYILIILYFLQYLISTKKLETEYSYTLHQPLIVTLYMYNEFERIAP